MKNEVCWVVNHVVRRESDISEIQIVIFRVEDKPRLLVANYRWFLVFGFSSETPDRNLVLIDYHIHFGIILVKT